MMKGTSNYRMQANMAKPMDSSSDPGSMSEQDDTGSSTPQPIMDNPDAMKMIDELKKMGYTGEDVEQAMGDGDESQSGGDGGAMATKAAPMQIPSMG